MPRGHVPKWHLNGAVVDSLPQGTEVHVTGKVLGTDWYECELDGKTVYMSDDWLDPELPQVMACTVDALNIRTGASTNYPVVGTPSPWRQGKDFRHGERLAQVLAGRRLDCLRCRRVHGGRLLRAAPRSAHAIQSVKCPRAGQEPRTGFCVEGAMVHDRFTAHACVATMKDKTATIVLHGRHISGAPRHVQSCTQVYNSSRCLSSDWM